MYYATRIMCFCASAVVNARQTVGLDKAAAGIVNPDLGAGSDSGSEAVP